MLTDSLGVSQLRQHDTAPPLRSFFMETCIFCENNAIVYFVVFLRGEPNDAQVCAYHTKTSLKEIVEFLDSFYDITIFFQRRRDN